MTESSWDPRETYSGRLNKAKGLVASQERRDGLLANTRFAVFSIGVAIAAAVWAAEAVSWHWLIVPVAAFLALAVYHERVIQRRDHARAVAAFYDRAMARLDGRWPGTGNPGDHLVPENHLYADDLDLFGHGSLFELLCTTRTRAGEETLGRWLCNSADAEEVAARQEAVQELRPNLDLRENLALVGREVREGVFPDDLVAWATKPPALSSPVVHGTAVALTLAALASLVGWLMGSSSIIWLAMVALVDLVFMRWVRPRLRKATGAMDEPMRELDVLAPALRLLEGQPVASALLVALKNEFSVEGKPASHRIAHLHRLLLWLDARRNQLFAPFAFVFLWEVHFGFAIERWRRINGGHVRQWLDAIGEIEALCALAAYAYEHPKDVFPEIVEGETLYEGVDLGHPLIAGEECVRNDIRLDADKALFIVSGSNMSGKSTLLRTVGINAVLAYCGGPVCAKSLRLTRFALGASLSTHDSIQEGTSRFYAEIKRLHRVMELTSGDAPVLFLLDEILHGTNSHDRRIGAVAVLKGLLDKGALGLVTTHDLALTEVEGVFGNRAANVHFIDHLEGDRLAFDFRMRPGVVERSNALALMRAVGLKI